MKLELSRKEKKRYALAMRRVDYGVWGHRVSKFYSVTLTTRKGDDNSVEKFVKDYKKLVMMIRKLGIKFDYCGCFEHSPERGLLHWHGLFRVNGAFFKLYKGDIKDMKRVRVGERWHSEHMKANRRALGDMWLECHNAFAVEIDSVQKMDYMTEYINKHMVKDYLASSEIRNKFLVSRGWSSPVIKDIQLEFKHWWLTAYEKTNWIGKNGYSVLNKLIKGWCENDGKVAIHIDGGSFMVNKEKIVATVEAVEATEGENIV